MLSEIPCEEKMYVLARSFLKFLSWNRWTAKTKEPNLKPESLRVIFKESLRKPNAIWDSNLENSVLRTLSKFQEAITFQIHTYFSVQNNNFSGTFINFEKKSPHTLPFAQTYLQLPLRQRGCRQCLPLSVVELKGKHCRKPHCCNGVVDTFVQW